MRTLGVIGGMSWYSTAEYYRIVNSVVQERLGGHHSAHLLLESLDFAQVRELQLADDWDAAGALLADAGRRLQAAGADAVLIATNLMHKVAPAVEAALDVPLLHIADAVAEVATAAGHRTLGVLGTRWVMAEPFYADRLARHGIATLVPDAPAQEEVDRIIFDELTQGSAPEGSRARLRGVVADLRAAGADAVVLACTELELALPPDDGPVPLIASARVHAEAAAAYALAGARVPTGGR
ncbi:aspartate/glutamate racemase family protein [Cellulomonas wangsupingiae]|uniref:Amino acid racemase n=1 Tax=Cellulomonas wangsupingiae TaxID=2968085 RepID=A0ABY5K6S3_9CELL|nr:amino acid racemase [Cellulomonas wangsupingiae]MCC2334380.1 amino acid racemase [Cellulomonas wangsupingiae]UUI66050.1 amino acid racemase [Cellulomonas wangsupingiae]